MKNGIERRLFVAATSQNVGKTSCSIGLMKGLGEYAESIGFIKPVGQRYVEVDGHKVDEDSVLIQQIYNFACPIKDLNPVSVPKDFTRRYIDDPDASHPKLVSSIQESFERISTDRDLVIIEGTGHAGVGSVFELSNADVARQLDAKVIIVTLGGIGKTVDEVALNRCLFERQGVEVIGVIANKVIPSKYEQTCEYLSKAFDRLGLSLFGVIPLKPRLTWPTIQQVADELKARVINGKDLLGNSVADVIIGAMTPPNALTFLRDKTLLIVPGDRDDIVLAAASMNVLRDDIQLSGILFTGGILPQPQTLDLLSRTNIPGLAVSGKTYETAAHVHDITVKIQVHEGEKIHLAEDMVRDHVNLDLIWSALNERQSCGKI